MILASIPSLYIATISSFVKKLAKSLPLKFKPFQTFGTGMRLQGMRMTILLQVVSLSVVVSAKDAVLRLSNLGVRMLGIKSKNGVPFGNLPSPPASCSVS
jgi:hypothetical protein